jgi:uncharacterized protein (TIGR00299 family) protein
LRILYFDCFSGASGDMILGALIDVGAPLDEVRAGIGALGLPGWELEVSEVRRAGLRAARARVMVQEEERERSYHDVVAAVGSSRLPGPVERLVQRAFSILARAEARVHGTSVDEVVFHEIGSLDALVDVVGSCTALSLLKPERVVASALPTGVGAVETSHGTWPLPAPAVVEILRESGAALGERGTVELVTPTGAALLAATVDEFGPMPAMRIRQTGYGAGARELDRPNVLRVLVGEGAEAERGEEALLLECNLDDMSPELMPDLIHGLLSAGARDAWVTPIVMKKGRPGHTLSVLVPPEDAEEVSDVVFREATTLGLRRTRVAREVLERRWVEVQIEGHPMRVKLGLRRGEVVTVAPEHDDAVVVARATGLALKNVYTAAVREAEATRERP